MSEASPQQKLQRPFVPLRLFLVQTGLVLLWFFLLRLVLLLSFKPSSGIAISDAVKVLLLGLRSDLLIALLLCIPLLLWLRLAPLKRLRRSSFALSVLLLLFWAIFTFGLFTEYFFFEEFRSRFNTVAVDYLLYPHEVFINIWDSYPVIKVAGICILGALMAVWLLRPSLKLLNGASFPPRFTRLAMLVVTALIVLLWFLGAAQLSRHSQERVFNELANNGQISFVTAFFTRHLDYGAFYRTTQTDEAFKLARQALKVPPETPPDSIQRHVTGRPDWKKLNVVLILEESLGSEFWGCLGRKEETLTPEMDTIATREGILFENIYATGNRTVRGFEGVLSSFPPLPGDSIVKRDRSENVESLARILKRHEYETVFLYGGRGVFDGMRAYSLDNGYDRFIEQKHIENPSFTTIWGVADEDLFKRAVVEFRQLNASGKPFLGTVLSVSNHKPYTYPAGRIPENPEDRRRENAVKYSDWCLGEFFRAAKKEVFWTNTVFVVVADHGARVYGSQSIPIHSYEIPWVIAGPAAVKTPSRNSQLGCSLDVAPTILGILGCPYDTMFYGQDLLANPPPRGRVLLNHNRDIGIFRDDRLVVLGLHQTVEYYHGDPKKVEMQRVLNPQAEDLDLEREAIALFQTADYLYMNRKYRVQPPAFTGGR